MPASSRPRPIRPAALLAALVLFLPANAQQVYHEATITHADRNGQRIWLHDGKPLQGLCRIDYLDFDFAPRYTLSRFRDGVRSDTVNYCSAETGKLLRTTIRLGDNSLHIYDFDRYDGSCLHEWTQTNGRIEGTLKEWWAEGKPRLEEEYKAGKLDGLRREWDETGRLVQECIYREDQMDGPAKSWHYEGPDWGRIEIAYHRQSDRPYMIERFAFADGQQGLIEREITDCDGGTRYRSGKRDCDSTRIDTLCGERMIVEIRDFREGRIRSLERYNVPYAGILIPHGVFEDYAPDGRVESRMRFDDGELTAARDYFGENPPKDVTTTTLLRDADDGLPYPASDSEYLKGDDDTRPLRIRNRAGEVIFESGDPDRRYAYLGYDPHLKLHVGFSSRGDWNDVRWYVVHDNGALLELRDDLLAVNGMSGLVAANAAPFEGETELSVYRYLGGEAPEGYFARVFCHTLSDIPGSVRGLHWIGESSLLLVTKKCCIRVDIAPESLTSEGATH